MDKKGNFVFYEVWDMFNYGLPMPCWEELTTYEDKDICIQFRAFEDQVIITHIEGKKHWSWNFDIVLWDFISKVKVPVAVVNVINKGLLKYFKKHNIKIYEV